MSQTVVTNDFVLVEDGKLTPELDAVIDEACREYPNIFNIVKLKENKGLGLALAEGIHHCKNELVARMDSDDFSIPTRCQKLLDVFERDSSLSIVGSFEAEFENYIENIVAIHRVPEKSEEIHSFMKSRCALLHPTVMYKKSAVIEAGNYRDVHLYEDYDLFMRMIIGHGMKGYNVQESLYYIRVNDAFFERRGGFEYMKTAVKFKYKQLSNRNISIKNFIISAGGQALVCLMPNSIRKAFYLKFLRR